jgi:hypothetical protein
MTSPAAIFRLPNHPHNRGAVMRRFSLSLIPVLLSGCATVQSTHAGSSDTARGMTYFLPARYVKLTAIKEIVDPPKIKSALDAKTKELEAAKTAAAAAEQFAQAKASVLARVPAAASAPTREAAVQASELAQAEAAVAIANRDGLVSTVADLKKQLEMAQATPGACGYSAKLELLPAQGDGTARFLANPRHNPLRDDSTKLIVTQEGLLSSANVIAADRTGDIIVEIAGAIGGFGSGPRIAALDGAAPAEDCTHNKKLIAIFDPARATEFERVRRDLRAANYPLLIHRVGGADQPPMAGSLPATWPSDVIYYRTPLPVLIRISECPALGCSDGEAKLMEEILVSIPQAGPISYIPQRSSAFVKTVNDVQFDNGVIKSWSADRPSEVLEIVRLPVRIMTALISVPANLFQLRVNYDTQAKNLADVQAAEMASSLKLRLLQACLAAAGEDAPAARRCLSQ